MWEALVENETNMLGQPVGVPVPDWTPPERPPREALEGRFCRVEPLDAERRANSLLNIKIPAISKLCLETFSEGRCAQVLHIGPFSEEGPTIKRVHEFIDSRTSRTGKHLERETTTHCNRAARRSSRRRRV